MKIQKFIEKAKTVHCDRYDYSKVDYVNTKTKVCIICPEHGEFYQRPNNHLNGNGCKSCVNENNRLKKQNNPSKFIERSVQIHKNKYNYSKVEYVNNKTKVCIICPEHGEFWQTPSHHIKGCGCSKCSTYRNRYTTKSFIDKCNIIHKNKYNYSNYIYVNSKTKGCIICPEHGEFWQTPDKHINQKQSCPICKESKLENKVRDILDKHNIDYEREKKFDWLGNLRLDFYLPDYNIAIECQGIQHFKPIPYFGGEEKLSYINHNDNIKKELSIKYKLKLFYINYNDNIKKELLKIIE